jgi:hypothetical protein
MVLTTLVTAQVTRARADVVIYDNTITFSGAGYSQGGAAGGIGSMVADDITVGAGGAGKAVDGLSFSSVNFNTVNVSAAPVVQIWSGDGAGGGPGSLLTTLTFGPVSLSAGSVQIFNYDPGSSTTLFTVPGNGFFWAGVTWTNGGGASGITAAQLNNVGQGLFNPPNPGSSQDVFFQTTNAGGTPTGGAIPGSNPNGSFFFFGGTPVANFGWQFLTPNVAVIPEPSTVVLSSVAGLFCLGFGVARKRLGRRTAA